MKNGDGLGNSAVSEQSHTPMPGARLALLLLLAINCFNYIDRQVLAAVVSPIEEEFFPKASREGEAADKLVKAKLGMLQPAFLFSYMLTAPLFGFWADRWPRWKLIGVGVIVWSLASGGSGWAPTFAVLFLTRLLVGIGEAAYGPAAPTIISDLYPVKVRGQVMAWFYAAIPVGSALGYVLGGAMKWLTSDWRWAFYAVLPPGILLGILCFFMPEPRRGQADLSGQQSARRAAWKDYLILLKTPSYVLVTLGMTAMTFAMGGMAFWMPYYVSKTRLWGDEGKVNLIFGGIVVVSGLIATLLGGWAGDRLRPRIPGSYFLVSGCSMILGFPMVLLTLWLPFPAAWIAVFFSCFFLFFNTGPTNTILANVTHPSQRASAFALNILVIHLFGDAISPPVIGLIASDKSWGLGGGFVMVSFMILIGGLLWLGGVHYLQRDTELAPTRL